MKALTMEKSRIGVRTWLAAASVATALVLGSVSGAQAQQTDPAAPAAPAADATAAPAVDPNAAPVVDPNAAAPAAAPVAGMAADPGLSAVENPYGPEHLWEESDIVGRGTALVLVLMSMGTWYILIVRLWDQSKLMSQAKTMRSKFWTAGSLKEGMAKLEKNSAYRSLVEDGLRASEHHDGKMTDRIDLNEWVTMSLQRSYDAVSSEMQEGLSFLASVGSTAPFVGLLGTVWGIIKALVAIGISGQASIDKVAGPVGEALIMTAFGLFVAIPAVLAYNWLVRRNKVALEEVRNFSADVHAVLVAGSRVS